MKNFLLILLFILLPAQSYAVNYCADREQYTPIETRYKKGLLFEVKKCGAETNYILGTMHSDDPQIVEMLDNSFAKLANSRSASFEIKFDEVSIRTTLAGMYYPPNTVETLRDAVGVQVYNKFVKIMAKMQPGYSENNFYRLRPWAGAVLIQQPENKSDGVVLDIKLQKLAESRNIPVYGLETAEEQLAVFQNIPEPKQVEFLRDTVENFDRVEKDNNELYDAYRAQDLKKLYALGEAAFARISDREFARRLKSDLVIKRNRQMAKSMLEHLDAGGAFVAVGALHLSGEKGILKQLEDKGYFIEVAEDPDNMM